LVGFIATFAPVAVRADYTPVPDPVTKVALESWFNRNSVDLIPLGSYNVIGQPFAGGSGNLSIDQYKAIKVAERYGLVIVNEDQSFDEFRQGKGFSWGQMLDMTTAGVQRKVSILATPKGRQEAASSGPTFLTISAGKFTISDIVKDEDIRKGADKLKVLFFTYHAVWNPIEEDMWRVIYGRDRAQDRKEKLLIKFDPFNKMWPFVAADISDNNQDFTTDNVNNWLRSH
jgi:hypothetical protein